MGSLGEAGVLAVHPGKVKDEENTRVCQLVMLVLLTTLPSSRIAAMAPATPQTPFYLLGFPRHAEPHSDLRALDRTSTVLTAPSAGSAFPEDTKCLLSSLSQAFL